jgi:hypothetical protein
VDLGTVITKATLADAFAIALRRANLTITRTDGPPMPGTAAGDRGKAR